MAANTQPIFPVAPKFNSVAIANADAQALKTIYTAGANGGRCSKLTLISTDTSNRDVGIYINSVLVATVQAPLGCGTSSSLPAKDVFSDANCKIGYYDACGNLVIDLAASATLAINAPVSVTAAKTITGVAICGDF